MYRPRSRHPALYAALDQVAFFLVVFLLMYACLLARGDWVSPARYGIFFLCWLPLIVTSAIFAGQAGRDEVPPVRRRDRFSLREIRPRQAPRDLPRRAA